VRSAHAAILAAVLAGACSFTPVEVEVRQALIEQLPAEVAQGTPRPATLLVLVPATAAPYDTTRIAYASAPHEIAYYSRTEWARTPARMLQPLLVQAMRATHAFAAVEAPPYLDRYRYALHTEIRELRMDFGAVPPAAHLALHARLADEESGRTLLDRNIAVEAPIGARTPEAGIAAANAATAKALAELAAEVVRALPG
jgi:cholesterol transport system auxiliary component